MTVAQTFWGVVKYAPFIWYCKLLGIPYVLHIHGGYLPKAYINMNNKKQSIIKRLINGSSSIIALSDSLSKEIKTVFPEAHVEVVENFYENALVNPPLAKLQSDVPHFLFLSNLMLGKGILEFLEALIILQDVYKFDFKVALAGNIEKGMKEQIEKRVTRLGDKVYFFGLADFTKKKELLYWADIFVLPTWYIMEGQPLSIIEAYVTKNIVISTYQGGIKDISNYDTFFKTEPQNAEILAQTMKNAAEQRSALSISVQKTADLTCERFNPERFGQKILTIFQNAS